MKYESFLTLHRQQRNWHVQGPERWKIHNLNSPCDINSSTVQLWSYKNTFLCKQNKNNDFIQQFLLFRVSLWHTFTTVPQNTCVCIPLIVNKPRCIRLMRQQHQTHAPRHSCKYMSNKKCQTCWIKSFFVFFAHKKYSCSFIILGLNHWTILLLRMSLLPFWVLNVVVILLSALSKSSRIILICVLKMKEGLRVLKQHKGE